MDTSDRQQRLSHISTLWTLVHKAHGDSADTAGAARHQLLERYSDAVYRYLVSALRDRDAADELFQEFSLRLLRGDFRNADATRGRFRRFCKTALYHLIIDYRKRQCARPSSLVDDVQERTQSNLDAAERELADGWREQLIDRAWQGLAELEKKTGQPVHTVLRFRSDHPVLSSAEMARQLGPLLGKALTVDGLRQALHRARERFSDLLLREVEHSLEDATMDALMDELSDLGLLTYCQLALQRRGCL